MNKPIFACLLLFTTINLHAQETPTKVPPVKTMLKTELPQLPKQLPNIKVTPIGIPTFTNILTRKTWNLTRWWTDAIRGYSISDPGFKFLADGTVSCNLWVPEAIDRFTSGTYSIISRNGNNINLVLKKGTNITMNCALNYNSTDGTLTGTYTLQVLPVTNPPANYKPGTVTGDMKLSQNP